MNFTQAEFDKLPALLTRVMTQQWTGLGKDQLTEAAKAGEIRTYPAFKWPYPKGRQHKYFKADVARICGMKV